LGFWPYLGKIAPSQKQKIPAISLNICYFRAFLMPKFWHVKPFKESIGVSLNLKSDEKKYFTPSFY